MLYGLNKQISHCYFRAAECRERAARCRSPADRQFHAEREQSWLTLARSYELQERLNRMIKELRGSEWRDDLPPEQSLWIKPPPCPGCRLQMQFQARQPVTCVFVDSSVSLERALFACTNCRYISEQLVASC
jgi:hypothetical protein